MRNRTIVLALLVTAVSGFAGGALFESKIQHVQAQTGSSFRFPCGFGTKGWRRYYRPVRARAGLAETSHFIARP